MTSVAILRTAMAMYSGVRLRQDPPMTKTSKPSDWCACKDQKEDNCDVVADHEERVRVDGDAEPW